MKCIICTLLTSALIILSSCSTPSPLYICGRICNSDTAGMDIYKDEGITCKCDTTSEE